MNVEANRLKTFRTWPSDAIVSPNRIAKAGFFYKTPPQTVECFACHKQITNWTYGDQVMSKHKLLDPLCPFVLNPSTSGNVPMSNLDLSGPSSSNSDTTSQFFNSEENRLRSFENWPVPEIVSPQSLARAGFFYLGEGDSTKCAYCKGTVRAWVPGDDPDREHQRHFPNCQFVINVINPRLGASTSSSDNDNKDSFPNLNIMSNNNLDELGVQTYKGPKKAEYATAEARLRTFSTWPSELIQTPSILSQAGFYYEGMGDQVRCFHCDGGLRHWDPTDDPWTEHARWFPNCSFVKLVKGQEFIASCCIEQPNSSNEGGHSERNPTRNRRKEITARDIEEHMKSEVVATVLSLGLSLESVKRAVKEKLEQTGEGYQNPDALVEAAFGLLDQDDDLSDIECEIPNRPENTLSTMINELSNSNNTSSRSDLTSANEKEVEKNKPVSLEEENRLLKEARLCKICMDGEVGIVFLPCGHLATCVNCAPNLADCPVCRSAIKATVRTFLS